MKKILALAAPAALLSIIAATDASAENIRFNPGIYRFFATTVTGKISLPNVTDSSLTGFGCSNVSVTATSKDMKPPAPGALFSSPKWIRSANASVVNGECHYSINVVPGSAFFLTTSGHGNYHCDVVETVMPSNGYVGPVTVPFNTTKTENLSITGVVCEVLK
jgi:hypothetical protein